MPGVSKPVADRRRRIAAYLAGRPPAWPAEIRRALNLTRGELWSALADRETFVPVENGWTLAGRPETVPEAGHHAPEEPAMRLITFEEKDAVALLEELQLQKFLSEPTGEAVRTCERYHMTRQDYEFLVGDIHRKFHYVVTRWLQTQGASAVRGV